METNRFIRSSLLRKHFCELNCKLKHGWYHKDKHSTRNHCHPCLFPWKRQSDDKKTNISGVNTSITLILKNKGSLKSRALCYSFWHCYCHLNLLLNGIYFVKGKGVILNTMPHKMSYPAFLFIFPFYCLGPCKRKDFFVTIGLFFMTLSLICCRRGYFG